MPRPTTTFSNSFSQDCLDDQLTDILRQGARTCWPKPRGRGRCFCHHNAGFKTEMAANALCARAICRSA